MTTIKKNFGIKKQINGYGVCTDISDDGQLYNVVTGLTYKRPEFALQKAEAFVKRVYKDFINFQGEPIHFEFENRGLVS